MEIELKYVAAYLPYGVMAYFGGIDLKAFLTVDTLKSFLSHPKTSKLILRPLSDLTKEIEVNGEKFVPIKKLALWLFNEEKENFDSFESAELWISGNVNYDKCDYLNLPYKIINKLIEWHFDVFGIL